MQRMVLVIVSTLVVTAATGAQAKSRHMSHHMTMSHAMKWMDTSGTGLPAGAKMAVVSGDPSKDGPFVIRAKLPANYTVPPHHHPTDEVVRVTSGGTLAYGMGDKVNTASSGALTKGYHVTMQAGMNHWVTTTTPLEIQVSAEKGPFEIVYANPADDPRKK